MSRCRPFPRNSTTLVVHPIKKQKILPEEATIEDFIKIYNDFGSSNATTRKHLVKKLNGILIHKLANYLNIDYYVMFISNVFYDKDQDVFNEIRDTFTFYSNKIIYKVYYEIIIKNNNKFKHLYNSNLPELKKRLTILNSSKSLNGHNGKFRFFLNNNNELILFNTTDKQKKYWYGNKVYPLYLLNFKFQINKEIDEEIDEKKDEEKGVEKEESSKENIKENELYPFISKILNDESQQKKEVEKYKKLYPISDYDDDVDHFGYDYDHLDFYKKDLDFNDSLYSNINRKSLADKKKISTFERNRKDLLPSPPSSPPPPVFFSKSSQINLSNIILKEILAISIRFKKASHQGIKFIQISTLKNLALVSKQFFKVISNIINSNYYEWNKSTINFGNAQYNLFQSPPSFFDYDSINTIPYDISVNRLQELFSSVETFHYNCDAFIFERNYRPTYDGYSSYKDKETDKNIRKNGYFVFPPSCIPLLKNLYINNFGNIQRDYDFYESFVTNLLLQYRKSI